LTEKRRRAYHLLLRASGNRLQQVTDHTPAVSSAAAHSDAALALTVSLSAQVLIFSQFTRMLDILEDYLALAAYPCERIDGSVGLRERQAAIDRYSKGASAPQ